MKEIKIAIGSDHAGFEYKEELKEFILELKAVLTDFGTHSHESVDYPDYVHPLCKSLLENKQDLGILICGSANGVAITANKYDGIRAAIAWQPEIAELAKRHNNANILCLPARFIEFELAKNCIERFLKTEFEGGRHQRRVDKMSIPC